LKVTLARGSGFCFGVRDAVEMAHESTDEYGSVYMLGDIVHNEHVVVDKLASVKDAPVAVNLIAVKHDHLYL